MIDRSLQPGDRVVLIEDNPDNNKHLVIGDEGTVCKLWKGNDISIWVDVEWDKSFPEGHNCDGTCEDGHGWKVHADLIDFVPDIEYDIEDDAVPDDYELLSFMCE